MLFFVFLFAGLFIHCLRRGLKLKLTRKPHQTQRNIFAIVICCLIIRSTLTERVYFGQQGPPILNTGFPKYVGLLPFNSQCEKQNLSP